LSAWFSLWIVLLSQKRKPLMRLQKAGLRFPKFLKPTLPWHEIDAITVTPTVFHIRHTKIEYDAVNMRFENPQNLRRTLLSRWLGVPGGWHGDYEFNVNKIWPMTGEQVRDLILDWRDKWQLPEAARPAPAVPSGVQVKSFSRKAQASMVYALLLAAFGPLILFIVLPMAWFGWLDGYTDPAIFAFRDGDYGRALNVFEWTAPWGSVNAQAHLGEIYRRGKGAAIDMEKAVYWFERAAGQDHAFSQNALGNIYRFGEGVPYPSTRNPEWPSITWATPLRRRVIPRRRFSTGSVH